MTPEEVRRLAALARLPLDDAGVAAMVGELGSILEHVRTLARADGADAALAATPHGGAPPLRPDTFGADLLHRTPDMLAPAWRDGHFVVPRLPELDPGAPRPEGETP
ncbi:MAG TPA: aspartyl/glutamyl-tRNA amidotransferase subunit C [Longimicrobiaceae bacterium]|nr:aspartyl/glutamyl-tRNA amidotransferase subunit C [Longimicrobiaceae bacterium]